MLTLAHDEWTTTDKFSDINSQVKINNLIFKLNYDKKTVRVSGWDRNLPDNTELNLLNNITCNGKWYYLNESGDMAANTTIDGYRFGNDGAWIE